MPIDPNVFDKIKNYSDYAQADQDFQMRKALAAQQLQSGGIDAASKANIYKTQLLSGAAAGGQGAYDQARATLQQQGIDTSEYAPDVNTATQQLQASRLAQSPLGTLFNAAQKDQSNQIALGGLTGQITPGARAPMIPGLSVSPATGSIGITPVAAPAPPSNIMPNGQPQNVVLPAVANPVPNPPASIVPPAEVNLDTVLNQVPKPTVSAQAASFSFRPQGPNESLPAYKDAQQQAFEEYKADPNYQASIAGAKTKAEKTAEQDVANLETAKSSQDIIGLYKKLHDEAPGVPSGVVSNLWAGATNAAGMPNAGAVAKGTYDADLNNLYLATIRSLKGTGRVQQSELEKIAQAAPSPNDSMAVKQAKADAHMQYYQQRMRELGFDPNTGTPSASNPLAPAISQGAPISAGNIKFLGFK